MLRQHTEKASGYNDNSNTTLKILGGVKIGRLASTTSSAEDDSACYKLYLCVDVCMSVRVYVRERERKGETERERKRKKVRER